jgi:hypothetical protein
MKSFLFILLPALAFGQNPYPDTLYLTDGRAYPCLITDINNAKVEMVYSNNRNESVILPAVNKIFLEELGSVYLTGTGFTTNIRIVKTYIIERLRKIEEKQIIKENNERIASFSDDSPGMTGLQLTKIRNADREINNSRWSFGVLYVPYFSGTVYTIVQDYSFPPYQPNVFGTAINETNMEVQLFFAPVLEFGFTFDVSYTSTFYERRYEYHSRGTNFNYDYGIYSKEGLKLLDFNIGLKYYFINIISEEVSIYALAGVGKQFAFAEEELETLFPEPTPVILSENNREEFIEDLNSPFHFNIGFGAEYFFSSSFSITSNIRFIYTSFSAKYDSRIITESETYTSTIDYKKSDFVTRIGLGLNFYF